ncbi:MAG: metalloregulator ArsR/SmtB family transcription factor [Methanobacterium sp. ERen5]|nr:MAG: metalloregulator ArsR/SmtB family transcription factor [Methanobacterium sp. ERen5]
MLYLLKHGDLCVCEIMAVLEIPQSTISHHLNVLKNVGILKSQKDGIWIQYGFKYPSITEMVVNKLIY